MRAAARRLQNALPIQLGGRGIRRLTVEVPVVLPSSGRRLLLENQNLPTKGHLWAARKFGAGKKDLVGLVATVHVITGKARSEVPPFLMLEYRKGNTPNKSDMAFGAFLGLVSAAQARSDVKEKTFAHAEFRVLRDDVSLPLPLPWRAPEIEVAGEIDGYRLTKTEDGKRIYSANVDSSGKRSVRIRLDFAMSTPEDWSSAPAQGLDKANVLFDTLFIREKDR